MYLVPRDVQQIIACRSLILQLYCAAVLQERASERHPVSLQHTNLCWTKGHGGDGSEDLCHDSHDDWFKDAANTAPLSAADGFWWRGNVLVEPVFDELRETLLAENHDSAYAEHSGLSAQTGRSASTWAGFTQVQISSICGPMRDAHLRSRPSIGDSVAL